MFNKIWAIVQKDLYTTFTDRNLVLIMFAVPLAIATIVGVVFGGLGDGDNLTLDRIPVAIVNLDEGYESFGQQANLGADFAALATGGEMTSGTSAVGSDTSTACPLSDAQSSGTSQSSMTDILAATEVATEAEARAGVESGDYDVAIVFPADFSASLSPRINEDEASPPADPVAVSIYANSAQSVDGAIVRSIVEGYVDTIQTGYIALETTINSLIASNPVAAIVGGNNDAANAVIACAFGDTLATIRLDRQSIEVQADDEPAVTGGAFSYILIQIGAAQAMVFGLFAAQFGIISIVEERREGTMQRMMLSPTPRNVIIGGKFTATFFMVVLQMSVLLLALTVIASFGAGTFVWLWGSNILLLVLLILAVAIAICGLSVILASIARTPEQVGTLGSVFNILLGLVAGAFGFPPILPVAYLSLIYWGVNGLEALAIGSTDITLNLLVLFGQGIVFFLLGTWLFSRRVEA
ncbi:MAG: hypothetical protein CL607_02985 [Anaerolineaceae bacterium]|nr:hypothetical protein [Anaerolineaceae bacterium]